MRLIRRRVRGLFAIQALIFLFYGIVGLTAAGSMAEVVTRQQYAIYLLYLVLGAINGIAFWSTRLASEYRNPWAISASALSIGSGLWRLWLHRETLSVTSPGVLTVIMGLAGLIIYSQGSSRREAKKAAG